MSKLLFIYERDMPTISITRETFDHLENYPEIQHTFVYLSDVKPTDIDNHDVIVFIRPNDNYSWTIAKAARKAGHVAVTFCDDDLLNLPNNSPTIPWRKKGLMKCLANSDVIWSSNQHILEKYRDLTVGKRTAITDTIVRSEEFEEVKRKGKDENVKLVYAAAPSHAALFEKYIGPSIPKLTEEFGNRISFTFISVHPEVKGVQCNYLAGMPLLEFRKYMKKQQFDIGLAPLHDDEFSKCKYFNKFLEYTTQGIVGVYSRTEPYTYVVRDKNNGFLADNNVESWYKVLRCAIKERNLRYACLDEAIKYVKTKHCEEACIEKMRQGIPEMFEDNGNYSKCYNFRINRIKYVMVRPFDLIYLTSFYLKNTGIRAVIKRIKRHFVESRAYSRRHKK